jgi:hypothetical protein
LSPNTRIKEHSKENIKEKKNGKQNQPRVHTTVPINGPVMWCHDQRQKVAHNLEQAKEQKKRGFEKKWAKTKQNIR